MRSYQELLALAESAEVVEPIPEDVAVDSRGDDLTIERDILAAIKLQVLGELENSKVKVFSESHRKIDIINDVSRLTYHRLLQLRGPGVRSKVHPGVA